MTREPTGSSPVSRSPALEALISAKRLKTERFSQASICAIWEKAVASAKDAEILGLSRDGSLQAAYNAGHGAALALLAAHGLRTSGDRDIMRSRLPQRAS